MPLVYIADDEPNIRRLVAFGLKDSGFESAEFADGETLLAGIKARKPDVIILDWMMPPPDGLAVCRTLRSDADTRDIPILMLTARDSEQDEVAGFGAGADEYIAKPFSPTILVTRVKNLLRRTSSNDMSDVSAGGVKVLYRERTVTVDGKKIITTPKEFDLLYYLIRNTNIVLTRDQIICTVWDMDYAGDDRTVDTHIKCLRAKLGPYAKCIVTVRKVGYKFEWLE